jgi:hypothetical protein
MHKLNLITDCSDWSERHVNTTMGRDIYGRFMASGILSNLPYYIHQHYDLNDLNHSKCVICERTLVRGTEEVIV